MSEDIRALLGIGPLMPAPRGAGLVGLYRIARVQSWTAPCGRPDDDDSCNSFESWFVHMTQEAKLVQLALFAERERGHEDELADEPFA